MEIKTKFNIGDLIKFNLERALEYLTKKDSKPISDTFNENLIKESKCLYVVTKLDVMVRPYFPKPYITTETARVEDLKKFKEKGVEHYYNYSRDKYVLYNMKKWENSDFPLGVFEDEQFYDVVNENQEGVE